MKNRTDKKEIQKETQMDAGLDANSEGSAAGRERQDPDGAGQSGDLQGLSGTADADSESVDELIEEGQFYEAEVVSGVENASDDAEKPLRTREVPEDDVPEEYREEGEERDDVKE
jgi:hypothetical protein